MAGARADPDPSCGFASQRADVAAEQMVSKWLDDDISEFAHEPVNPGYSTEEFFSDQDDWCRSREDGWLHED